MKKLASWFTLGSRTMASIFKMATAFLTAEKRQAIQLFLGSLAPVLIFAGLATEAQAEQWQIIATAGIQFAASGLSLINLRGAWNVWTALRGTIYTIGATVAPALTVLGVIDEATQGTIFTGLSLTLSTLSSLLAIFVSGQQQTAAVVLAQSPDGVWRADAVRPISGDPPTHILPEPQYQREHVGQGYLDYLDEVAAEADPHRDGKGIS